MVWFNLSLLSAASKAANQAVTKTLTRDFSVLQIATFGQLAAGLIIFPFFFFPGTINIPNEILFHRAAAVAIVLNIIAILLLVEAIRRSDLSYSLPFLGFTPVFLIFNGRILRGEEISVLGILGILLVFFGAFGIDAQSWRDWLQLGGRRIFRDNGVRMVILVAFIYSLSSVYDKTAMLASDPLTYVWYSAVIRAIFFILIYAGRKFSTNSVNNRNDFSLNHFCLFILLGITFIAEALFQMSALQTGLVAYVIAIKRLSILMTSLVGMFVYKEIFSWARLSGAALIVAGAGVIYISG